MTRTTLGTLREVQELDDRIQTLEQEIAAFEPRLAEVEEPALKLESELGSLEERVARMGTDARRLERAADEKQERVSMLEKRLNQVQNVREETAVRTEMDLLKRALDTDEQEALQLMDQTRRSELVLDELREKADEARAAVAPSQEAFLSEIKELRGELAELRLKRDAILEGIGPQELRIYESFHASGRTVVVTALLDDGACGNCYGLVPLQQQNEIRRGDGLHRCEFCGVILSMEDPIADDAGAGADADDAEVGTEPDDTGAGTAPA